MKDKEKQRESARLRMQRMREKRNKSVTENKENVTPTLVTPIKDVTPELPLLPVIKFDLVKVLDIQKKMQDYYDANRRREQW